MEPIKKKCAFGKSCKFLAENKCRNYHEPNDSKNEKPVCKFGSSCKNIKSNSCRFWHDPEVNVEAQQEPPKNNDEGSPPEKAIGDEEPIDQRKCKFGWSCLFLLSYGECKSEHSDEEKFYAINERECKNKTKTVCNPKEKCKHISSNTCRNLHYKDDYEAVPGFGRSCSVCRTIKMEFFCYRPCYHEICCDCFEKKNNSKCHFK